MEIENWQLISKCKPASSEEAGRFLQEFSRIPYADLLIQKFKTSTDPDTWMIGPGIVGNVVAEGIEPSMRLYGNNPNLVLEIYNWPMDMIEESGYCVVGAARRLVEITSRPAEQGVWAAGRGNKLRWTLDMNFSHLYLPSRLGRWALKTAYEFAQLASEFYDPLKEQPVFWDSQDHR